MDEKFNLITKLSYHIYYKKSMKKSLICNQISSSILSIYTVFQQIFIYYFLLKNIWKKITIIPYFNCK